MSRFAFVPIVLLGCGCFSGGAAKKPKFVAPAQTEPEAIQVPMSTFARDLYGELPKPGTANRLVSPLSVETCLALLLNGTKGQTTEDLKHTLRLDGRSLDQVNAGLHGLLDDLRRDKGCQVTVSNSIWTIPSVRFDPDYVSRMGSLYDATLSPLKDMGPAGVAQINDWVKSHTKDRIDKIIDSLDRSEVSVLVNAVTFDGKWKTPFDKGATSDQTFHVPTGDADVPTMRQTEHYGYRRGESYEAVEIPYAGGAFAMRIVLPHVGVAPEAALAQDLDAQTPFTMAKVDLTLPRFTYRDRLELNDPLKRMGMGPLFERGDFTGMAPSGDLTSVSRVVHRTYIKVDEEGTQAAAATGIIMRATAVRVDPLAPFHVDRPFAFSIVQTQSGLPLFMGVVNDPRSAGG